MNERHSETCEVWLQITAGRGPVECSWAVVQVMEQIRAEAAGLGFDARVVEYHPGSRNGTAQSVLMALSGETQLAAFAATWRGTVQWIARSPFRPEHKRKNWFVGVEVLEPVEAALFNLQEISWETMRASGPGGRHVNRTESAVRVTHVPTGIQASASEERSQHRNRKLALARLAGKLAEAEAKKRDQNKERRWQAHQELQRGNPVRVFGKESWAIMVLDKRRPIVTACIGDRRSSVASGPEKCETRFSPCSPPRAALHL
jgi:peptide chain release factor